MGLGHRNRKPKTTQPKILIIATSADRLTNGEATGLWLEELTTPYYAFVDQGASVTLISVAGGAIPVDVRSVSEPGSNDASVDRYLNDPDLQQTVRKTLRFTYINASPFDAVFLPGGHGTMMDYPANDALTASIETFERTAKDIGTVCHGPAGLVAAKSPEGTPVFAGKRIAAFTDSEEHAVGLQDAVRFPLQSRMVDLGAEVAAAPDFQAYAVRDGTLITGQNPASAAATAVRILEAVEDVGAVACDG